MLSREQFLQASIDKLAALYPSYSFERTPSFGLRVVRPDGATVALFLERAYSHYSASPHALNDIIATCIRDIENSRLSDQASSFDHVRGYILPLLKPAVYERVVREQLQSAKAPESAMPVLRSLGGVASIAYAMDIPDQPNRGLVSHDEVKGWGTAPDLIHQVALENLARKDKIRMNSGSTEAFGAFLAIEPLNVYNASRILLTDLLDQMVATLKEDLIISIPTQNLFLAVGLSNERGRAWLRGVAQQKHVTGPNPVTSSMFAYRHGVGLGVVA